MANQGEEEEKLEDVNSEGRTKECPLESRYAGEERPTMELRQEVVKESQVENSKFSLRVEPTPRQITEIKSANINRGEEEFMMIEKVSKEGGKKESADNCALDGLRSGSGPKRVFVSPRCQSQIDEVQIGVGSPDCYPQEVNKRWVDGTEKNHNKGLVDETEKNHSKGLVVEPEKNHSNGDLSKQVRKDRKEAENSKLKTKKRDMFGMGRGKVSFHLLKKKARSSGQKLGQKYLNRIGENSNQERRKKKNENWTSSGSFMAASDDLRSSDSTSDAIEFGKQLGLSWDGKERKDDQIGT
ncbi:hypothetical protein L6452_30815 [Arctium lappa]|uniref:Uncharacterized protein n=1 Tax=Arctium lappa TaxID=4217 RepID=A0ACB8ZJF4_ARCLA|nr:hypothetical protein L6452_30815 [Arctium lappa]